MSKVYDMKCKSRLTLFVGADFPGYNWHSNFQACESKQAINVSDVSGFLSFLFTLVYTYIYSTTMEHT